MTSPSPSRGGSNNGKIVWIGAAVVVVLLGIVAVVVSSGGDDDVEEVAGQTAAVSVGDGSTTSVAGDGGQSTQPNAAPSDALPAYDPAVSPDPAIGMTIPTVNGTDLAGNDMTIEPDGKAKVIVFVAHWCPHCQREIPRLKAHLEENPMPDDVELLTVSTSVQPSADNYPPGPWLESEGWEAPVLADDESGTVAQAFGLSGFPYFVVVDADGKVVSRASGEQTTEQFDAAVSAAQG